MKYVTLLFADKCALFGSRSIKAHLPMLLVLLLVACQKETEEPDMPSYSTACSVMVKVDFGERPDFDLYVFDFMGDACVQDLHQLPGAKGWGTVSIPLSVGHHDIYFVASQGKGCSINPDAHHIIWEETGDTFWGKLSMDVADNGSFNEVAILERVTTRLRIRVDFEPGEGLSTMNFAVAQWYSGLDYTTGLPACEKKNVMAESQPLLSYLSTGGTAVAELVGISKARDWNTDVEVSAVRPPLGVYDPAESAGRILTWNMKNAVLERGKTTNCKIQFERDRHGSHTGNIYVLEYSISEW